MDHSENESGMYCKQ